MRKEMMEHIRKLKRMPTKQELEMFAAIALEDAMEKAVASRRLRSRGF